jgi:hypothetical protein
MSKSTRTRYWAVFKHQVISHLEAVKVGRYRQFPSRPEALKSAEPFSNPKMKMVFRFCSGQCRPGMDREVGLYLASVTIDDGGYA